MAGHTQTIDIFFKALQFVLGPEFKELELVLCAVSLFSQCFVLFFAFLQLRVSVNDKVIGRPQVWEKVGKTDFK